MTTDKELEAILLNRVKVIGDNEWTLLGTPNDILEELTNLLNRERLEAIEGLYELIDPDAYESIDQQIHNYEEICEAIEEQYNILKKQKDLL